MQRLDWARDGADWPNRDCSRFVQAGAVRWHVQVAGDGPALLLVHGTGAATHSWRDLLPLLAKDFTVVAPDLPGHGFTSPGHGAASSLPGMAGGLAALLAALDIAPVGAVGHSAGAAVVTRMALDGRLGSAQALVSLNGALLPWRGVPGAMFAGTARLMSMAPLVPTLFARRAQDPRALERLLASTGSTLDARGRTLYARLIRNPGHVAGALALMARWDLRPLVAALPRLDTPLVLVVGERDGTVPPAEADRVRTYLPAARIVRQPGLGHLAHEEAPDRTAALIREICAGTLAPDRGDC